MGVILLLSMFLHIYIPMSGMDQDVQERLQPIFPSLKIVGSKAEEKDHTLYQEAIVAIRESNDTDLPNLLAQINPNAQVTEVPGNPCRIHFLLTIALYENKTDAIRYLLDAGADPLITPRLEAEGEQEHAPTILVDALNLNCALSAEIVLSHIPRPLLLKYGSKTALVHLLLCFRRIRSDLPRDIRTLLCRYCVTACVQDKQFERAKNICKSCIFKPLTSEEGTELRLANLECFDVRTLPRFYPIWHEQVTILLKKQMSSP